MIDKATIQRMLEEIAACQNTPTEDMEAWGIDPDAFIEISEQVSRTTWLQVPKDGPRLALHTMFYFAFALGLKCAHENAMQLMVDS